MKRKLLLLNLALLALSALGVMHLRREWIEARTREQAVLRKPIQPTPLPPITPLPVTEPVKPARYRDIVRKMLFSRDRNSVVVVEPPPPPKAIPMPTLPLFHGVMDLGDGPMAIMSDWPNGPHRDYRPGDKVGAFNLVAVNNEELVLQWEGLTITRKVNEILYRSTGARPAPGPVAAAAAAPGPPPMAQALAAPGGDMGWGLKACQPDDTSPAGTVADGMRKLIVRTTFGSSKCYWESAN